LGEVLVSFHPAGHILGSAQIRLECEGRIWVISGDYKRQADPTCRPFEPVPCDVFISEATFGLPIYNWQATEQVAEEIFEWWRENQRVGRNSLLACYSLGKAQRVLHALAAFTDQPVLTHGATEQLNEAYREEGVSLIETIKVNESHKNCRGELILAPPSAIDSSWAKRFGDAERGFASGWMQIRGQRRRRGYERGFVLSDHADWSGLLQSIRESEAQKIYVTHGYASELSRYLRDQGYDAEPLQTLFVGEGDS
jgi:putative mRNA 3-end processing factor